MVDMLSQRMTTILDPLYIW